MSINGSRSSSRFKLFSSKSGTSKPVSAPQRTHRTEPTRTYTPMHLSRDHSLPRVVHDAEKPQIDEIPATSRAYVHRPSRFASGSEHYPEMQRQAEHARTRRLAKSKNFKKKYKAFSAITVIFVTFLYTYIAFFSTGILGNLRDLYIETAIMTFSHNWLATCMFPSSVVDVTRDRITSFEHEQEGLVSDWSNIPAKQGGIVIEGHSDPDKPTETDIPDEPDTDTEPAPLEYWEDPQSSFYSLFDELDPETLSEYIHAHPGECFDEYGYIFIDKADIDEDDTDIMTRQGDPVIAVDERDGILLARVSGGSFLSGNNYRGVIAFIKDPSSVTLGTSSRFGAVGQKIGKIAENNGAILGVNASGFADDEGHGNGGVVHGLVVSEGKTLARAAGGTYFSIYFDSEDHLNVSAYYKGLDIVNGVEFKPAIIVNGQNKISNESFGIQPRTAIAQKADETVMMLVVDGRQSTYSLGTTVTELEVIFERYDALQAACLDGGSSSVMYFNGRLVTSSSSPQEGGRFLPDAFLVLPKDFEN